MSSKIQIVSQKVIKIIDPLFGELYIKIEKIDRISCPNKSESRWSFFIWIGGSGINVYSPIEQENKDDFQTVLKLIS